ncbi:ABC transporter permease [Curvibacter sp. CHRR-16]|uniref:ABC transporter permease n=1 Tax=Curvibacter sp. CHRR-16 TaxID=2835872 RepID=UPI001BDA4F3E|nr:ABC transporter permease [Curvibacter sp. CHRR-16]MBT0571556.1 ABC transporter permease [Curvibacter sp. CHRR-16]
MTSTHRHIPWGALGPWIALAVASAFFATQSDRFFTGENLSLVLQQVMVVGVLAIGQTLIILTAGIDLSCGMVMSLAAMVMAKLAVEANLHPVIAVGGGLLVAAAFGLLNGLLVTRFKLPSFIVTLGTMNIAFAVNQLYSRSQTVVNLPPALTAVGDTFKFAGTEISWGTLLMVGLYVLVWRFLRDTAPGRHLYAVGNHPEAARLTGIRVEKVLVLVYVGAAVFYGLAAMLSIGRTGVGDPQAGQTENLDAITAVVLGGTSLFGGRGIVLGSLVGAVIVGVFRNGLTLMGVASVVQTLITGILVILAVLLDQMSRKGAR